MNFAIRFAAETEMQMNAIERIKEYSALANENYEGKYDFISFIMSTWFNL